MPYKRKMLEIGESFTYLGKENTIKDEKPLPYSNKLQHAHLQKKQGKNPDIDVDVYAPIEAYTERWQTKTKKNGYWEDYVSAHPIPNTRKRNDLPPIASQWRDSYKKGR